MRQFIFVLHDSLLALKLHVEQLNERLSAQLLSTQVFAPLPDTNFSQVGLFLIFLLGLSNVLILTPHTMRKLPKLFHKFFAVWFVSYGTLLYYSLVSSVLGNFSSLLPLPAEIMFAETTLTLIQVISGVIAISGVKLTWDRLMNLLRFKTI